MTPLTSRLLHPNPKVPQEAFPEPALPALLVYIKDVWGGALNPTYLG